MILSTLNHVLKLLGGGPAEPVDRQAVFNETVLLVLSRATDSDANIKPIEIDTVRGIIAKTTGEEVSAADVRVAAHSKIYEDAPLERNLARVADKLDVHDRVQIAKALAGSDPVRRAGDGQGSALLQHRGRLAGVDARYLVRAVRHGLRGAFHFPFTSF